MFIELIESILTKYQWRRTKYRHENGKILEVLLPPCYVKPGARLTFNELAEAKMLLTLSKSAQESDPAAEKSAAACIECGYPVDSKQCDEFHEGHRR